MKQDLKSEKRVVIVDDSRTIQAMLDSIFCPGSGFHVVGVASDAKTAIEMVKRLRPDLITIDLCMPYIDGTSLLAMLADEREACKIVVSDHAATNVAMVAKLRSLGAAACVTKAEIAASRAAFVQKIRSVVAGHQTSGNSHRLLPTLTVLNIASRARPTVSAFGFPVPADESQRLEFLYRKQLANAAPERQFDLLTTYVAKLTGFPVCLMTFIDRETQWLKSSFGLPTPHMQRSEAFCAYTICQDDTFIVRNAANDPAFANNPLVTGDPHIKTYVGHPIITDEGVHVGALCVIDTQVRVVSDGIIGRLMGMAEIAAEIINQRPRMAA